MIDLDKAWELARGCAGDFDVDGCELMRAVITELRAAREVVEEADRYRAFLPNSVVEAIDEYTGVGGGPA